MSSYVESRRASRRAVVLPCQAVREHDFKLIADRTIDISVDGLLLPLRTKVLTGESLIVSFQIPGMWIDAEGVVARVIHGRRPGDDGLAVGILFHTIAPSARAALAGYLHGRRIPVPRRGPTFVQDMEDLVDEADIEDDDSVDGLGILRAVVDAWQSLAVENVSAG